MESRFAGDAPLSFRTLCWSLVGTILAGSSAHAHSPTDDGKARPSIEILITAETLTPDGRLDEAAWKEAAVASGFTQRNPNPGEPASERTEFQVAMNEDTLFVAVRCYDREPDKIIAREMQRDGALFRDDAVALLLDTFHDHRNTYFFETNPNGTRTDALINDEGRRVSFQWDGIWRVGSRRTEEGWVAEYAIPFSSLRFDPKLDTWGLNIRRLVRRRNEISFWSPIDLEANVFRVSRFGHLTGIAAPKPGLNLQVKPFVTGALVDPTPGATKTDSEVGLDIKWGVTRNLALDLTYNTDFAEVETDNVEVNLTRFSLFFPEKREFFLENSGIFSFGPGAPQLDLFFSRRIGISPSGEPIPIRWGARLTGRVGLWNLGFLEAETEAATEAETGNRTPKTQWAAVRLQRNLGDRSTVGLLVTQKDVDGMSTDGSGDNLALGLDFNLNPTDRLNLTGFWARTDDDSEAPEEDPLDPTPESSGEWAGGVAAAWSGAIWEVEGGFQEIRDAFEPAAGFVLRRGIRRYSTEISYEPRPENPRIRNFDFGIEAELITRLDDSLESLELQAQLFGLSLESAHDLRVFAELQEEDLEEPFEIRPGIVIPAGRYSFHSGLVVLDSDSSRRFSAELATRFGEFFNGDRLGTDLTFRFRPNRFFRSETTWSRNDIDLPAGSFATDLIRQRLGVAFNPDLSLNSFVQYSDASEQLNLNLRLNWIYRPGADLFLVYNQIWNAPSLGDLTSAERQLILKFTYLFAF